MFLMFRGISFPPFFERSIDRFLPRKSGAEEQFLKNCTDFRSDNFAFSPKI